MMKNGLNWHRMASGLKKCASLVLALLVCVSTAGFALAEQPTQELIVGTPTACKGDFFTEMFGNNTADIDVRALIHGYSLVNWDQSQGVYVIDPSVVESVTVTTSPEGDRGYHLILRDDLYYSDGSPITAWDYAFSLLLTMSPEIEQIGGTIFHAEHIKGAYDYLAGRSRTLQGVRVYGERELGITLDAAFLPYFYEVGLLLCAPYPIAVLAPGCKVYDDGEGVYIANADSKTEHTAYTAELLRRTILDPETGYNSHPAVCSGPYVLTSFDGTTCHFARNPYFKGAWMGSSAPEGVPSDRVTQIIDYRGQPACLVRPVIERIAFTTADMNTLQEDFENGKIHLVNKVVYGPTVMNMLATRQQRQNYPRIGLSFLTFTHERPTVHEMAVRQAIAWCMDRDQLTKEYCKGLGFRVDGYFGIEQWEYLMLNGSLDYPVEYDGNDQAYDEAVSTWEGLRMDLTQYRVDTDKANALLDGAGWTLNRAGEAYRPGVDDVRCKLVNGELAALDLSLMYPEGNHIVDTMQENFINHLNACGIRLTLVPTPMQELLASYYREAPRTTDMIYLATNFHVFVDPAITYSADPTANHQVWNNIYSDDEELYQRAVDIRQTQPGDYFTYMQKWIRFQERYNEVLPAIPVYSNIYFDFFVPQLQNYRITAHVTWSQAILCASLTEETPLP